MSEMTEKRLAEIEARLFLVRGEWYADAKNDPCRVELYEVGTGPDGSDSCIGWGIDSSAAEIAVNAPTNLRDLLDEVRWLRDENDRLRPIVDHFLRGGYLHPEQIAALLRAGKAKEVSGE